MKKTISILVFSILLLACSKNSCYDSSLVHNNPCTADCPGFDGCDGKLTVMDVKLQDEGSDQNKYFN